MTNGTHGPGKRVRVTPSEYEGTDVYHALYLPAEWEAGRLYPVIVEYTGNYAPSLESTGEGEGCETGLWIVGRELYTGCHALCE